MTILHLGVAISIAADRTQTDESGGIVGLVAAGTVIMLAIGLLVWAIFYRGADGGDSGPDDDGPGWRPRRRPRTPPEPPPVSWPDFERRFANSVRWSPRSSPTAGHVP